MLLPWGCPVRASLARVPHGKGGPACLWGSSGAAVGPGCAAPAWLCQAATAWQLAHGLTSPQGTRFPPWRIRARPRCHLHLWGLACPGPPPHPPGASSHLWLRWPGRVWVPQPGAAKAPNHTETGKSPSFSFCYWKLRAWEGESETLPMHMAVLGQ